jgi:hypothetical protein
VDVPTNEDYPWVRDERERARRNWRRTWREPTPAELRIAVLAVVGIVLIGVVLALAVAAHVGR